MRIKAVITYLAILMYSCDDECGEDINLGKIELAETTQEYVPYTGEEVLIFEDNTGVRHTLNSTEGRKSYDTKLVLNTLCRGNVDKLSFDDQQEYYQSQREEIIFYDQSGNQIFYIDLMILFERIGQSDSVAIYDLLSVHPSVNGSTFGNLNIVTSERQYEMSPSFKEVVLNNSMYIGDTVLFGKEFSEVYRSSSLDGRHTFYNRKKGVLAFVFNENEYWVLAEKR